MKNKFAVLEKEIINTIEQMPEPQFDAHQLILILARKNQRAYIDVLNESRSDTPFQAVHSLIGKFLKMHSLKPEARIREIEQNSISLNIFGINSSCSKWERLD